MKIKRFTAIATATVLAALCICIPHSSASTVDNAQVQSLQQQIAANADKQAQLDAELKELQNNLASEWEQKAVLDKYVESTLQQINDIDTLISKLEKDIADLSALDIETSEKIESQRQAFLSRMAALHEDGNASYLELVLGSEDLTTFLTKFDYVNSMLEYDKKVIAELKESKKLLAETREKKEKDLATQKAAKETHEAQKAQFESLVKVQENLINEINADAAQIESLKNQAAAEESALDSKLTELLLEIQRQEELAKQEQEKQEQENNQQQAPNITPDGQYMWPLTEGWISSAFGGRDLNGAYDYHAATDIAAPTGTPIYAANNGTVVISEYHSSYGNYVLINHGNGEATLYAHMSVRMCNAGDTVAKGQIIGQVGNTGYSFGSHLHLEFRINGQRVDAEQYIPH